MHIAASQLYDHVSCRHRVALDAFGDEQRREPVSPFVRMLWERGSAFERDVIATLPAGTVEIAADEGDRETSTIAAMRAGADIIRSGRISADDLLGESDLLIRIGDASCMPADIKSGRSDEGDGPDASRKPHYAVQVGLYVDVFERLGRSAGRVAEIWDVSGRRVRYQLDDRRGPRTEGTWRTLDERCGYPAVRRRIIDYNEDDCRATIVLLDGIRGLAAASPKAPHASVMPRIGVRRRHRECHCGRRLAPGRRHGRGLVHHRTSYRRPLKARAKT